MTTPQGPGPSHNPADPPVWGQPPAGGWGAEKDAAPEDERTQRVDPRAWSQAAQPHQSQPQQGQGQPQQGQPGSDDQTQHYGGPQHGAHQAGGPQHAAPPPYQGGQQPYGPQQGGQPHYGAPPPYGAPQHAAPQYGGPQHAAPPYGAPQQGGQPQYGGQPAPPYPGQQPYGGAPQPGQQDGWGRPADQGWGQAPPPPPQQWAGPPPGAQAPEAQSWAPPQPDVAQDYPPLPDAAEKPRRSKLPLIIGVILVLAIAVGAVLAFVYPGFLVKKVFDTAAVQAGVQKVLTDNYAVQGVSGVTCGQKIAVANGTTFTCDATIDGQTVKVPVRITSADGNYEVGRPG